MFNISGSVRLWITAGVLLESSALLHAVSHAEASVPRRPLGELPYSLGTWKGQERSMEERIVQAVGVSDYVNRVYSDAGDAGVQLYIGYYASQRTGDTIHSPKNCLPGAGWDPIHSGYVRLSVPGGSKIVVNEYVVQQDLDKRLVFYWYHGRGRVIASEYYGKFWMVADAISRNRTDGALVRLITPMNDGAANAHARLVSFAQVLFPQLDDLIPN